MHAVDDDFEERQPEAAREQEPGQGRLRFAARAGEERRRSGQEDERRAQKCVTQRVRKFAGVVVVRSVASRNKPIRKEVADVIECHQDHDQPRRKSIESSRAGLGCIECDFRIGQDGAHD